MAEGTFVVFVSVIGKCNNIIVVIGITCLDIHSDYKAIRKFVCMEYNQAIR